MRFTDYFEATIPNGHRKASEFVLENNPSQYEEGEGACGWAIGTNNWALETTGPDRCGGPGNGGLASKLSGTTGTSHETDRYSRDIHILRSRM